jgi:integrase
MKIHLLKEKDLLTLPAGEHSDGGGLVLVVKPSGARNWVFICRWAGERKKLGFGSPQPGTVRHNSLAEARQLAHDARKRISDGINPVLDRPDAPAVQRTSPTFQEFAAHIRKKVIHGMAEKSVARWDRGVNVYAAPLHDKEIATITRQDVVACLEPIWLTIPVAAKKFQSHLVDVFDRAVAAEIISDQVRNPADFALLKKLLEKQPTEGSVRGSHASMPYEDLPAFWQRLVAIETIAAKTLQLAILCCVRTGEAIQAQDNQFDLDKGKWTIPGKVMKNGKEADIAMSKEAVALVREMQTWKAQLGITTPYLFPGADMKGEQSNNTLLKLIKKQLGVPVTTHGFRTSFRSWTQDKTAHDNETLEYCLHHIKGDTAEAAYKKGQMWEKRQAALQDWADYVAGRALPKRRAKLELVA